MSDMELILLAQRLKGVVMFSLLVIAILCGIAGSMIEAFLYDQEKKAK